MLRLSVCLVWTVKLIWDWDSECVHKDGSEGDTPLQGPGAESFLGGSCHFLLRFSRDPAASRLSWGPGSLRGKSEAWSSLAPKESWRTSSSGVALFFQEAVDGLESE